MRGTGPDVRSSPLPRVGLSCGILMTAAKLWEYPGRNAAPSRGQSTNDTQTVASGAERQRSHERGRQDTLLIPSLPQIPTPQHGTGEACQQHWALPEDACTEKAASKLSLLPGALWNGPLDRECRPSKLECSVLESAPRTCSKIIPLSSFP